MAVTSEEEKPALRRFNLLAAVICNAYHEGKFATIPPADLEALLNAYLEAGRDAGLTEVGIRTALQEALKLVPDPC